MGRAYRGEAQRAVMYVAVRARSRERTGFCGADRASRRGIAMYRREVAASRAQVAGLEQEVGGSARESTPLERAANPQRPRSLAAIPDGWSRAPSCLIRPG